ncbi:MAG TPA: hypothetical protein VHZ28_06795 [Terracidiphilus sp.]|jgi:hypothetical protein|nr:hypothetical protein [Terracidiphilus sp.]
MSEPDQHNASSKKPEKIGTQEAFHAPQEFPSDDQFIVRKPAKKSSGPLILILGFVAVVGVLGITLTQKQYLTPKASTDSDDLGAGVATASGLRGHLVTRWQGKTQYMLKMEPMDPRYAAGFSSVAANPPKAITINIRLIDAAGFALCGKEIVLHNSVQRAAQQTGVDVFQNIQGHDGSVEALWAEGELPCSPDQYKKFDYWDISTNFPTLAEQETLLGHRPMVAGHPQTASSNQGEGKPKRKPVVKAPVSTYSVEGDDQISMYEASRSLLTDESGRSFYIPVKTDQAIAANWAANYSHIHFKCDQHSNCALRTGSGAILGRMSD